MASTISTSLVPMPNASAPNAPCVAVCESPHTMVMPGCVRPSSGPITWTMPCVSLPNAWIGTPNSAQLVSSCLICAAACRSTIGRPRGVVGVRVVRGGHGLVRPTHADAAIAQPGEGLGAGDLVDEMEVDRQDGRGPWVLGDDMLVPDLLDEGSRCGHRRVRSCCGEGVASVAALAASRPASLRGSRARTAARTAGRGPARPHPPRTKVAVRDVAPRAGKRLHSANPLHDGPAGVAALGFFENRDRRAVAVVVTTDGRRVTVPTRDLQLGVSPLDLLRSLLLGLEGLLGLLITGSRRENGGTRRIGRR